MADIPRFSRHGPSSPKGRYPFLLNLEYLAASRCSRPRDPLPPLFISHFAPLGSHHPHSTSIHNTTDDVGPSGVPSLRTYRREPSFPRRRVCGGRRRRVFQMLRVRQSEAAASNRPDDVPSRAMEKKTQNTEYSCEGGGAEEGLRLRAEQTRDRWEACERRSAENTEPPRTCKQM